VLRSAAFTGTLGELAHALRSGQLEPEALDLLALVRAYLAYFERLAERSLELASEGLPLVARVIELKVRLLLPRPPRAAAEADDLLEETLEAVTLLEDLEHAIRFLKDRREARRTVLPASAPRPDYPRARRPLTVPLGKLRELAARHSVSAYFELALERFSMADAMKALLARVRARGRGRLDDLAERRTWSVLSVTFAGMLELYKENKLRAYQDAPFGPIVLEACQSASEHPEEATRVEAA
jgi:segregation and condensation protein A